MFSATEDPTAFLARGNGFFEQGNLDAAIGCYRQALKIQPDYLDALIAVGMALSQGGRGAQAEAWLLLAKDRLEAAIAADPQNVDALNQLGTVLQRLCRLEEAALCYRDALLARPAYVPAAANLAICLRGMQRFEEAVSMCRYALGFAPESPDMHINLGIFLQELSRHEEAIAAFDEALKHKPLWPVAQWNKAFSLLALGRYAEGWALHEVGLGIPSMRCHCPSPERLWRGENLKGKRLLLWCEQGLGDGLQFVRYAAMCKDLGCRVIVQCAATLLRLFANDLHIDALIETVREEDFDFHLPMMSLPYVFGTLLETIPTPIPYLHVSAATRAAWAERFVDISGFKVGLVWAGNPRAGQINAHMTDKRRSLSLEQLRPLFAVEGARFYNLQMGAKAGQIDTCGLRDRFIDFMPEVRDFEDTAAMIENLDLVISVDTSVAHLAGGLGKPVWVLSRFDACWRWLQNRPDSPWYPTARVFGQKEHGHWATVVEAVREELEARISLTSNP